MGISTYMSPDARVVAKRKCGGKGSLLVFFDIPFINFLSAGASPEKGFSLLWTRGTLINDKVAPPNSLRFLIPQDFIVMESPFLHACLPVSKLCKKKKIVSSTIHLCSYIMKKYE